MSDEAPVPAWGYREGEAKIFDDGVLPKGWVDSPAKVKAKAKAEEAEAKIFDDGVLPKGWVDSPAKVKAKAKGKAEEAEAPATEAGE